MGQTQQAEKSQEIDVKALQDMYKRFVTECPSGLLFLHEFKRFFIVDPTGEASDYAENMFRAFDKNGDNTLDFLEFVAALNLVFRGNLEHKLRWSFKVYDKDNNGFVDKDELRSIIDSIHRLKKGSQTEANDSQLTLDEVVDRLLASVDSDGDGQISVEEFLKGAQQDPWVPRIQKLDLNPAGWVLDQRGGVPEGSAAGPLGAPHPEAGPEPCWMGAGSEEEEFLKGAQQDPWVPRIQKLDLNPAGWVLDQRRRSS
ncbi:guanylyl cyclase-activating protein 2-like [Brachionichthys hirsutus]|uniref:guanylyl cyclase-activating protein 2-like n=1 Tax=Brachionichthys hirsutus TaxID=412623 RepID=UPI003604E6EB